MRKVVQIAVVQESETAQPAVLALDDDGTVWVGSLMSKTTPCWRQLPPLPSKPNGDAP